MKKINLLKRKKSFFKHIKAMINQWQINLLKFKILSQNLKKNLKNYQKINNLLEIYKIRKLIIKIAQV